MDSSAIADPRQTSLAVLASEINAHHQAAEAALNRGLEEAHKCGELLLEAKAAGTRCKNVFPKVLYYEPELWLKLKRDGWLRHCHRRGGADG